MGFLIAECMEVGESGKQPYVLDYPTQIKFYAYTAMHILFVSGGKPMEVYLQKLHRGEYGFGAV